MASPSFSSFTHTATNLGLRRDHLSHTSYFLIREMRIAIFCWYTSHSTPDCVKRIYPLLRRNCAYVVGDDEHFPPDARVVSGNTLLVMRMGVSVEHHAHDEEERGEDPRQNGRVVHLREQKSELG